MANATARLRVRAQQPVDRASRLRRPGRGDGGGWGGRPARGRAAALRAWGAARAGRGGGAGAGASGRRRAPFAGVRAFRPRAVWGLGGPPLAPARLPPFESAELSPLFRW